MEKQVKLTISTDLYWTADFLRELANEIENKGDDLVEYESEHAIAKIEWPDD